MAFKSIFSKSKQSLIRDLHLLQLGLFQDNLIHFHMSFQGSQLDLNPQV